MSIRRRLVLSLLALWATIWGAIALIVVERSHHEVEELLDAELAQIAHVLRSIVLSGNLLPGEPQTLSPIGHPYESKISFQLWDGDELIGSFGAAPETRLAEQLGFSGQVIGTTRWRVFGLPNRDADQVLYVAQELSIRHELVTYLTLHALQPILWSLPIALVLIWLAVADSLRGLRRLARDLAERSESRLDPLPENGLPKEVRPVIRSLNGLMDKLRRTLAAERRFAADASHELRTPLAIIQTHSQLARQTQDPAVLHDALDAMDAGVERAARLVTQLLSLSRLTYDTAKRESDTDSLLSAVADAVEDRRKAADAKGIDLRCSLPSAEDVPVGLSPAILDVLIGNLVDNAVKFTPPGGQITVDVQRRDKTVTLVVSDTGPGIPEHERHRVFQRFYRSNDQSHPGAGLGLSIVKRICDVHGISLSVDDAGSTGPPKGAGPGLRVELRFPRLDASNRGRRRLPDAGPPSGLRG
jgi:signal transduction histidine kinase